MTELSNSTAVLDEPIVYDVDMTSSGSEINSLKPHPEQRKIDELSNALHDAIDNHLDSIVDAVNFGPGNHTDLTNHVGEAERTGGRLNYANKLLGLIKNYTQNALREVPEVTVGGKEVDPKVTASVVSVTGLLLLVMVIIFFRWLCIRKKKVEAEERKWFKNIEHMEVIHDEDI